MTPALLNAPARYPVRTLMLAFLAAALAALSASRMHPDTSLEGLFPPQDKAAAALNRVFKEFPAADDLLVLATAPGNDPQPEKLLAFAERLEKSVDPESRRLISSIKYRADSASVDFFTKVVVPYGIFYLTDAEFAAAQQRLTRPEMADQFRSNEAMLAAPGPAAGALAKVFLQDPLRLREFLEQRLVAAKPFKTYSGSDAFLSPDGRSLLIKIAGTRPPSDLDFCRQITASVTQLAQRANTDQLHIEFSGAYPIASQSERSIRRDSISSVIGSVTGLAVLFLLAFRKPLRRFALTFTPVAFGILYGFGVFALFSRNVSPLTAVVGGVLGGIGIDYSIFYLLHYLERRDAGDAPVAAAAETLRTIGGALLAAWVTSVVGFIAIVFASVPALRAFAIVGSLGLAGALGGAVFVLPALLALFDFAPTNRSFATPKRSAARRGETNAGALPPLRLSIRPLLNWIDRHAVACLRTGTALFAVIILGLLIAGPKLALETDPTVLHPRPNPPLDAERHIAQRMGGAAESLIVHLQAGSPEDIVALAHRVAERLDSPRGKSAGVQYTFGLASLLPDPAAAPHRLSQIGPALADRVTADFDAAVADSSFNPEAYETYKTFLRVLLTPTAPPGIKDLLPYRQLAETFLPRSAFTGQPAAESITLVFLSDSISTHGSREACITELRALLADCPGATLTGITVLGLDTEATILRDLPRLIAAAVGIVAVYLLLHFRSITPALLAVLPTLCSLTCRLAIAKIAGEKLNLANIISVPLLIGIDVDYGIFLVSVARRTRTRAELLDRVAASSQAVILCATATLLGFGSLAFTSVPAIRSLGWAVAIGVTVCATASIFFLLPLLLWLKDREHRMSARTSAKAVAQLAIVALILTSLGCEAPTGRLSFPTAPIAHADNIDWYDVRHDGTSGFGVAYDSAGNVDRLLYLDIANSGVPRVYRISDYSNASVPHVILLLDSIPYDTIAERYAAGDFRWFGPPQKLIAPFPSLTEVCYTAVLRAPPLIGDIDTYYDPRLRQRTQNLWKRGRGYSQPWERRLDYHIDLWQQGMSFLDPDNWYAGELEAARRAIEESPDRVPIVYCSSAAGLVCKYGRPGAEQVLDGARQLCLQLLYERRGAIKISMMADHGHNYTPSKNCSVADLLKQAGFRPADRVDGDLDVVVEINALVTSCGIHTRRPPAVAAALCRHEQVELAIYQEGDRSIVQSSQGRAAIECRGHQLRYRPLDADVLHYEPVIQRLTAENKMTPDGFADDETWFRATLDHPWPNAPRRIWDALHGSFVTPPDVFVSLKDGYCCGYPDYERYIKMMSTHGGLNQVNSATFVMTMTGRITQPVRQEDLISTLEPGLDLRPKR